MDNWFLEGNYEYNKDETRFVNFWMKHSDNPTILKDFLNDFFSKYMFYLYEGDLPMLNTLPITSLDDLMIRSDSTDHEGQDFTNNINDYRRILEYICIRGFVNFQVDEMIYNLNRQLRIKKIQNNFVN